MIGTRRILRGQRGFSLAELLVAVAVLGLLVGAIVTIQQQGQAAYMMGSSRVEAQQNARVVLDLLTRELRSAGGPPADPAPIIAIGDPGDPGDLTFMGACDPPDPTSHEIRYQLSGTTLNRTCNGTLSELLSGVKLFEMDYWDRDYRDDRDDTATGPPRTLVPANVRVITIRLWTEGSMGDQRAVMKSTVRLRNQ